MRFRGCLLAVFTAVLMTSSVSVASAAHQLLLDYDHDGSPWTLQTVSGLTEDTVTVILQVGDESISAGETLTGWFHSHEVCHTEPPDEGTWCYVFAGPAWDPSSESWCNPALCSECSWAVPIGLGCEDPVFYSRLRIQLHPGERHVLGRMVVSISPCSGTSGPGHFHVGSTLTEGNSPTSIIGENAASAPSGDGEHRRPVTFGRIKEAFRR